MKRTVLYVTPELFLSRVIIESLQSTEFEVIAVNDSDAVIAAQQHGQSVGVLIIDLDHPISHYPLSMLKDGDHPMYAVYKQVYPHCPNVRQVVFTSTLLKISPEVFGINGEELPDDNHTFRSTESGARDFARYIRRIATNSQSA